MPQCAPSIISAFSSANAPLAPSSHSELLALQGRVVGCVCVYVGGGGGGGVVTWLNSNLKGVCVCACMWLLQGEICCVYVWAIWSTQGCKVGSPPTPPTRWISWHMQAMNYQATRVNYPKREKGGKKRNMDPTPVAPGSLFQFRDWFSQNVEGKRREEKQPWRSEGGMMRSWGGWVGGEHISVSPHLFFLHLSPSLSLPPEQIQEAKHFVKMQNAIIRPSECTNATYDGWVWDLERPPVQHWASHVSLVYKPFQTPGWNTPNGRLGLYIELSGYIYSWYHNC